jgi:sporulation protein YlmC with PRC-barrel domain
MEGQAMVEPMPQNQEALKTNETSTLISADKVKGTDIYNSAGEHLGEVDTVMIDKLSGKIAYAVVTFGGFMGMGSDRYALPWQILTYDSKEQGYIIDVTNDVLRSTPVLRDHADRMWGTQLHEHFRVPPYWI